MAVLGDQPGDGGGGVGHLEGTAEGAREGSKLGWQRQTLFSRCIAQAERLIGARGTGREQKSGWGVTYIARVRVTVSAGIHGTLSLPLL